MNSKKILACNWKMNPGCQTQVADLIQVYTSLPQTNFDLIVFPPAVFLNQFKSSNAMVYGVQEVATVDNGAFTGQISVEMAVDFGCQYSLVGHSETRDYFHISDEMITQKLTRALNQKLTPILCIGHSQNKQKTEIDYAELTVQLNAYASALEDKNIAYPQNIIIAYEPVWAIGTGLVATNEIIFEVTEFIKNHLGQMLSFESSFEIKVLYGGSVNAKNIQLLSQIENLDGFLVGGASLDPEQMKMFANIL